LKRAPFLNPNPNRKKGKEGGSDNLPCERRSVRLRLPLLRWLREKTGDTSLGGGDLKTGERKTNCFDRTKTDLGKKNGPPPPPGGVTGAGKEKKRRAGVLLHFGGDQQEGGEHEALVSLVKPGKPPDREIDKGTKLPSSLSR